MLVGGSDSIIRLFTNDNMRLIPKPTLLFTDRFLRKEMANNPVGTVIEAAIDSNPVGSNCDYFCTSSGVLLVVAVTTNSKCRLI